MRYLTCSNLFMDHHSKWRVHMHILHGHKAPWSYTGLQQKQKQINQGAHAHYGDDDNNDHNDIFWHNDDNEWWQWQLWPDDDDDSYRMIIMTKWWYKKMQITKESKDY